jgi:hypothetical protein
MGQLISGKVNRGTYPTKDYRFSCHVNVEHLAENGNESKYSKSMLVVWEDNTLQRLTPKREGFVYSRASKHKCS